MILEKMPEVQRLSKAEKVMLAEELFAETGYSETEVVENEEHKKIIEERWAHYLQHPDTASSWEDVRERMKKLRNEN